MNNIISIVLFATFFLFFFATDNWVQNDNSITKITIYSMNWTILTNTAISPKSFLDNAKSH